MDAVRTVVSQRRCRGISAVEFTITLPFLLFVMLATAELGRAFVQYAVLSNSIRHAARHAASNAIDGTTGVVDITAALRTEVQNLAVYGNTAGTGSPRLPYYAPEQVTVADVGGGNVQVVATYPYSPMLGPTLPTIGLGSPPSLDFDMQIAVTMRGL